MTKIGHDTLSAKKHLKTSINFLNFKSSLKMKISKFKKV